jgi:electron transport complex protein RnfE
MDALGMGIGFTFGLCVLGTIREILGSGSIFGFQLVADSSMHMLVMVMAPGAFFTLGTCIMILQYRSMKRRAS